MEIYLIMLNNVQKGNKYVKMDSEIGKGVQALKHPLPGSSVYYTDFQLFPDISDVVQDNDNYKIMVLIMNTKSGEKELITILPASHLSNCFI